MTTLSQDTAASPQQGAVSEGILPALSIAQEECQSIQTSAMSILEKSWAWLAGVLDVVEGQLRMGKNFDTKVVSYFFLLTCQSYRSQFIVIVLRRGTPQGRILVGYYGLNANSSLTFQAIKNFSAHPAHLYFRLLSIWG